MPSSKRKYNIGFANIEYRGKNVIIIKLVDNEQVLSFRENRMTLELSRIYIYMRQ